MPFSAITKQKKGIDIMHITISRKAKETFSKIVSVILVIFTIIGLASLANYFISSLDDDELTKIHPSYSIGALTSEGKYTESESSIYTKEAFECGGLEITPVFDTTITYQVFFYDYLGNYVDSTDVLEGAYRDGVPAGATHARIVITPVWEDDVKEKDRKINIFQIAKYSNQLTVKVLKEQEEVDTVREHAVFENVKLDAGDVSGLVAYNYSACSFVYADLNLFENSTVTKIGVPIKTVKDCTKDSVLTVYVIDSSNLTSTNYIDKYELVIGANTFSSNTVNDWYYFNDLNIRVGEGQTLAFTTSSDTVIPGYLYSASGYGFHGKCLKGSDVTITTELSKGIFYDVWCK